VARLDWAIDGGRFSASKPHHTLCMILTQAPRGSRAATSPSRSPDNSRSQWTLLCIMC